MVTAVVGACMWSSGGGKSIESGRKLIGTFAYARYPQPALALGDEPGESWDVAVAAILFWRSWLAAAGCWVEAGFCGAGAAAKIGCMLHTVNPSRRDPESAWQAVCETSIIRVQSTADVRCAWTACAYVHAYVHTYLPTYIHIHVPTHIHAYVRSTEGPTQPRRAKAFPIHAGRP